jgi:hypothetical protein
MLLTPNYEMLVIHIVATAIMVGVIWVIQLVHYPSFYFIKQKNYKSFQNFHMKNITYIVFPIMSIELFSGFFLVLIFEDSKILSVLYFSLFFLLSNWALTGIIFTRLHSELLEGYNKLIIKNMIKWNWIRTLFWSIRLFLLFYIFLLK